MRITKITSSLEKIGMPKFWQIYIFLHAIFALSLQLMNNDSLLFNFSNTLLTSLVFLGIIGGIKHQNHPALPWRLLSTGSFFIGASILLHSLTYIGLSINSILILGIEEIGLILVGLFSFTFMLRFEREFSLNGFTIDFSLIIITLVFFVLLISPDLLDSFLYKISFIQQLDFLNLFFSLILLSMTVLHHILSRDVLLKDVARIIIVISLIIHFTLEILGSFQLIEASSILLQTSWSFYHLAGTFAIAFTFLEKFTSDYYHNYSIRISSHFMWAASIMAILIIPVGLIIRYSLGFTPINLLIIGITSASLSSIVIWRFQILIKSTNLQRKKLKALAHTDALTGQPNYHGYLEKISSINIDEMLVVNINVEDFKSINDLYGRQFGDEVLKSLGNRLSKLKNITVVARTGSDNFMAVFQTPNTKIYSQLKAIENELDIWDIIMGRRIAVPFTFGASHGTEKDPEILARQAEKALIIARDKHINFYLFTSEKQNKLLPRHELRGIMQQALDHNFLPVHFQPIYNIEDGSLKALELLIRLQSKEHGLLLPGQFLDQAQGYGLLTPLTKVCVNMIAKNYSKLPDVMININLPSYMLDNPRILNEFLDSFKKANLSPARFCIEVMEDEDIPAEHLVSSVNLLKSLGFAIAMDDFGTGYSSLARLSMLPFDTVKIDRSLLLAASAGNKAILESTITLIKRLGLSAVVEGVETLEQLALIRLLGADSVQGFLLSKPVDIKTATALPLNAANIIEEF